MAARRILTFDVGGTLVRTSSGGFCSQLCSLVGKSIDELRPLLVRCFLTRDVPIEQAVREFCSETGMSSPEYLLESYRIPIPTLFADVPCSLQKLRAMGFEMYTLSNCTAWEAGDLDELGIARFFECHFSSFEIGYAKPDPTLFRYVERKLCASPGMIIHIGDSVRADIHGAINCGWRAVALERTPDPAMDLLGSRAIRLRSLDDLPALFSDNVID